MTNVTELPHRPSKPVRDTVGAQSRDARLFRLSKGRCPLHDKPLLQCDVWYRNDKGTRYTLAACMHHRCHLETVVDEGFTKFTLTTPWKFLLEQDTLGCGKILNLYPPI